MAERTKAALFSRTVFTSFGSGTNPDATEIHYSLLFREFQFAAYYLAKLANGKSPPSYFCRYVLNVHL
jgi:hypothetical protein